MKSPKVILDSTSAAARAAAGVALKNLVLKHRSAPLLDVKARIVAGLLLLDTTVRNITGNVITAIFSAHGVDGWPQVLPKLLLLVDGDDVAPLCREAAASALAKICEDSGASLDHDYEGLLAPVIRSAETKRLKAIAGEISDLANRARSRKLSPDEISGGTFTISNNGSAGSVLTMPIINQPQVGIISTDAIVRKPVVTTGSDGGEAIAIHPVGNLAMSWDHRAFDGAYAAGFLKKVKEILETKDWNTEL